MTLELSDVQVETLSIFLWFALLNLKPRQDLSQGDFDYYSTARVALSSSQISDLHEIFAALPDVA